MSESESESERAIRWRHLDRPDAAKPPPLEHARAVKLRLRAASKKATEARKEWTGLRLLMATALDDEARAMHAEAIGSYTLKMWATERGLAAVAEEWRQCLADRAAMPVTERWNLAALERWAVAQDTAGAP